MGLLESEPPVPIRRRVWVKSPEDDHAEDCEGFYSRGYGFTCGGCGPGGHYETVTVDPALEDLLNAAAEAERTIEYRELEEHADHLRNLQDIAAMERIRASFPPEAADLYRRGYESDAFRVNAEMKGDAGLGLADKLPNN